MAKTNAQRQAEYRRRRAAWPTNEEGMKQLILAAYTLGRLDELQRKAHPNLETLAARTAEQYINHQIRPTEQP